MATNTLSQMTQLDVAKRTKDNNVIAIAEQFNEKNEILGSAPMVEANLVHSHMLQRRSGLPTISLRGPNQGTTPVRSEVKQVTESMSLFDDIIPIDEVLLKGISNPDAMRQSEIVAHVEAISQAFHEQIFYGNPGDNPLELSGLATRFKLTTATDEKGDSNVRKKSGTGNDLTSLWFVEWGPDKIHLIYPKGNPAGIYQEDHGREMMGDATNGYYYAKVYQLMLEFGLAIHREDAVQRIANIESTGTSNNLIASNGMFDLIDAKNALPNYGKGAVIYCNVDLKTQFDKWALDKDNMYFTLETLQNYDTVTRFMGVPIRIVEQISSTESAIS